MIHSLSDCKNLKIPKSTNIWQFCVISPKCQIGENCNICSHCLIENDVVIGNNVTIKSCVQIWDGIEIEDNVCIGANVTFTNDHYPRAKNPDWRMENIKICKGASVGAGSTRDGRNAAWRRGDCAWRIPILPLFLPLRRTG